MYLLTEKLTSSLIMYMVFKRITKHWTKWDAYKHGIIDDKGKRIKKPKTAKEREGWDILDRFCWSIKRLCTKYIGDSTFAYYFSAAYLMKEQAEIIFKSNKKYLLELEDITIQQQKLLFDCITEMEYNSILNESHLDIEINLLKIVNKTKTIVERYDFGFLIESIDNNGEVSYKQNILKLQEANTQKIYSARNVLKLQDEGVGGNELVLDKNMKFIKTTMDIDSIITIADTRAIDEILDSKEDIRQINELKERYTSGLNMNPIVVDIDNMILDGYHRISALYELGYKTIEVFKEIPTQEGLTEEEVDTTPTTGTTLGDVAQFTPRLGSMLRRKLKFKKRKLNKTKTI